MDDKPPPDDTVVPLHGRIDTIRSEIDGIDSTLLSLVAERLKLADKLIAAKAPESGLPIRPGREIALLRQLVAKAPAPLERELVIELWRALIAASLRRQRVIDVAVGGNRNDFLLFDLARRHFGARARVQHVGEPQAALQRAADNPDSLVAVTPWPASTGGAWWPALTANRYQKLHLIAALPVLDDAGEQPKAAVFGAARPEEAGGDVTMLLGFDEHYRLARALAASGLEGKEAARSADKLLVRIEGFLAVDDPRIGALTSHGLESMRVLGSYARIA